MCAHWIFVGSGRALSGLQDLDAQVASCRNVSNSDHICTNTTNLHLVNLSPSVSMFSLVASWPHKVCNINLLSVNRGIKAAHCCANQIRLGSRWPL